MLGAGFVRNRLMDSWVEVGADRLDGRDTPLAQEIEQLPVDDLDALSIRVGPLALELHAERALEIVDRRQ